ncbi:unnamed protein product [Paramecium primaurelia]|uniref:Transmembrane protein n=1 Tax=Paramecium primaurelia TaxID=5886 RepID=A0A8S1QPH1_PARPR|nr:unnamed protein product [Paramecium primaurelia]
MIFFILTIFVQSCFWKYEDMTLYPTNGEYLEYPMNQLLNEKLFFNHYENIQLIYHYEPSVPNVQITNAFNEIIQIEGHEFISVSSNQTHFATITKDYYIILYQWKNLNIQQQGQGVKIEKIYKCYNIVFFADIDILLDCYTEGHFHLLQLMNTSFEIVYSIQANKPIKSQMQGIYNESKPFLIYAQYYQNISIITLFSSQFKNLTFYQDQFIQIAIPLRENPFIYILEQSIIKLFIISQNNTFELIAPFDLGFYGKVDNFQVYYNYQIYFQCDQILVNYYYKKYREEYLGCQNQLILLNSYFINIKQQKLIQSFLNNEFIVIQQELQLTLYQQQESNSIGSILINDNTQIYLNTYDNYLFMFNRQIIVYELKIQQLSINLTDQQVQGITYDITIFAKQFNLTFIGICKMFMSITILDQNDTNIYVMFNKNFPQYRYISYDEKDEKIFVGYSGKLLQYTLNTDNKQFGQFSQTTFKEGLIYINNSFNLAQFYKRQLIGVTNESIQILDISFTPYSYEKLMDINISIQAQQLQVSDCDHYSLSYCHLIIGLSDDYTVYLYLIYYQKNYYSSSEFKFEQQIQQFFITQYNLITLIINQEIQIMTLNFTDLVIINETMINTLFNADSKLKFNPIQIVVNNQRFSQYLLINNIDNVIIISIIQSNILIPISIIEVKFQIKQINIVNQLLVLSYICNKGFDLCFQVWSIENFKYPFFMRNMTSVDYKNYLQILSDNFFFYVQFLNYTVYVYNPQLPQHMSLYYQINLSTKLNCTDYYNFGSILYFENQISSLSIQQSFNLKVNQAQNFSRSYPQMIYNYTVTSLLNVTANQSTPNQSLTYLSNFTYFQPKTIIIKDLLITDLNLTDRTFTIPMNIILDRQASLCYFPNSSDVDKIDRFNQSDQQYFTNDECNLTNFGYFKTTTTNQTYTLVTAVNNQFFVLQNNSVIDIYNQYFVQLTSFNYSNLNFAECLKSTSYNLTLSSICQNDTAQYWLSIYFDSNGSVINRSLMQIPFKFTYIKKISNIATLNFILGSNNTYNRGLYLLNPLNNSMQQLNQYQGQIYCKDFSVSLYNSSLDMNQSNLVLVIYIMDDVIYQYINFNKNSITLSGSQGFYIYPYYFTQILILQVKFQIKQINIVNQQLVLSYICNYGFDLCFQVWSIQNFKYPFFMRNMPNVQNKNNIQILSDDWFFYVQFQNYNLYVYNPKLPQHMSLYYLLILSSKLISTIQYSLKSILYFETYINSLSTEQNFQFKVNQSLNFSHSYPQLIYNYTITSLVNQTANQTTPNQSLTYLSNFTYFQPKTTITVDLLIQDLNLTDRTFTIPVNIILDRQASLCYFPKSSDVDKIDKKVDQFDQQYFTNDECNLTNFVYFTKNIDLNYTQVTAVNNKFFILQNNSAIRIVNQYFEFLQSYDYSNLNFTECLKSTSYNLSLSSICQNDTAQYWLSIYFDSNGIVINRSLLQIAYKFTYISKISNIAALNFILGSYNQNSQNLYLLNPLNNSIQLLISDCQDFSVSLYNSSLDMNQSNLVIIIYISNYYDVFYQYLYFNKYSITQSNFLVLFSDNLLYAQILILQIIDKQIFFLITSTEGFGYLLFYKLFQNQLSFQDLITTIPAYVNDDIVLVPNFVYSNGFLLQQFKQGNTYIIGVYYITDLLINNLEEPILMLGQLNSTSSGYALITNIEDRNATCLALNNGSVLYYPISTRTLKCHYRQDKKTKHVNIICKNDFSDGVYDINFMLPDLNYNSRRWIYSLIIIIILQLIGFYILVKYRMRNIGYINTEIEL